MKAWHFVGKTLRDGRPIPADGVWLVHDGALVMCSSGLHFSVHPFDALRYAPGATLCQVEVEDYTIEGDKGVSRQRKIIARRDATVMLRAFARAQALSVIHLWDAPAVVREYLETGVEDLRAAARAATWAAEAAWDAAWDATRAAAEAAEADARAAARDATRADAEADARAAARADFSRRVAELFSAVADDGAEADV